MPYRIENYIKDLNKPIRKQLIHYYDYCKYELKFTTATMNGKMSSINHFVRASGIKRLEDLDNDMVSEYIKQQTAQGLKPRTINNRIKHLLAMARYYRDIEDIEIPNLKDKKIKKQHEEPSDKRAFKREVIYEALRYADRETWLLIKTGFDCGLRMCELRAMRLRDLNGDQLTVHGKGGKKRFVILSEDVIVRLQDWIKREKITDYIWRGQSYKYPNSPRSYNTLRKMMRKPFEAANIVGFCPHELRHSYATDLANLGLDPRRIQQGLGHSSVTITEIYLHELNGKSLQDIYDVKYSAAAPELR